MDEARKVLDVRLARGEITIDERRALSAALSPSEVETPVAKALALPPQHSWRRKALIAGIGAVVVGAMIGFERGDGLNIGNLNAAGEMIGFRLANSSNRSGDLVIWVTQTGNDHCEHVFNVESKGTYDIRFGCPSLTDVDYRVLYTWVERAQRRAAVAKRIARK